MCEVKDRFQWVSVNWFLLSETVLSFPKEPISVICDSVYVPYSVSKSVASVHGHLLWLGLPGTSGVSSVREEPRFVTAADPRRLPTRNVKCNSSYHL